MLQMYLYWFGDRHRIVRFSSVDARTHEIAAALINLGLIKLIFTKTFRQQQRESLKTLGYCLSEKLEVLQNTTQQ